MSGCNPCCKCYEQADGTIIKRGERDGAFYYTLPDLTVVTEAPEGFTSKVEVDCSKFEMATQPPKSIKVLEEVCDESQTGVLVHVEQLSDGTITYTNLATGEEYVPTSENCSLHTAEDTDYNEHTYFVCDSGIDVKVTVIYKDGDIEDVVSTTTTTLSGAPHELSKEGVTAGSCSGLVTYDYEYDKCFKDPSSADNPTVHGYIKTATNSATGIAATTWHLMSDDSELDKETFIPVKCC